MTNDSVTDSLYTSALHECSLFILKPSIKLTRNKYISEVTANDWTGVEQQTKRPDRSIVITVKVSIQYR